MLPPGEQAVLHTHYLYLQKASGISYGLVSYYWEDKFTVLYFTLS